MVLSNLQKKILIKQLEYNLTSKINDTNKLIKVSKLSSNSLIEYLRGEPELVYPVKSYAVAIVYSLLLERRYKISFWDSISNDLLLCNNDKFFISYKKNKKIYKRCISFFWEE